jgi:hypothetical protein
MFFTLFVHLLLHYHGFIRLPEDVDAELISSFPQPNRPGTLADYLQDIPSSAQKTSAHAPDLRLRRVSLIARGFAIKLCCLPYHPTRSTLSILFSKLNTEPMLSPGKLHYKGVVFLHNRNKSPQKYCKAFRFG